ncbi:MAG: EMC3/TMCO1 family protein [Candidatus Methanoplasma sp.]|nr:EMC3/TMCO1 family protein [Candidatus Methanoplasma sp.]
MPNPGSPESVQTKQNMPGFSKGTMIGMFATLGIMMVVMMFRGPIGEGLNVAFQVIDFGYNFPVLTLVIAGLIMITLSTVIRSLMTDFVAQARNQKIQSEFNKEMRTAMTENNLYQLKKLQEEQPKITAKSMEASTQMMKVMPITMVVVIPVYAWVWFFIEKASEATGGTLDVAMPWGMVDLAAPLWILPGIWIIIYTMISLPIGQLENRVVRYFLLKKRMSMLESGAITAEEYPPKAPKRSESSEKSADKVKSVFAKVLRKPGSREETQSSNKDEKTSKDGSREQPQKKR